MRSNYETGSMSGAGVGLSGVGVGRRLNWYKGNRIM